MNSRLDPWDEVRKHYYQVSRWCAAHAGKPTPWVTMLYGSQNYGLESADSDVDTKSMVLPTLEMVANETKHISTELVMENGSLDNCKDFREMFNNYLKGNINFVETLYTPYYFCNEEYRAEFFELKSHRVLIANARPRNLIHMAAGMAEQKYKAFDHPFEGKKEVLAKYGYDPKQLHHLVRLSYFMETYLLTRNFGKSLYCCDKSENSTLYKYVMEFKVTPYPYTQALKLRDEYKNRVDDMLANADNLPVDNGYEKVVRLMNGLKLQLVKKVLRKELMTS